MIVDFKQKIFITAILGVFLLGTGILVAQVNNPEGQDDKAFLRKVSLGTIWKIETGKIAGRQASATEVREFGDHMAARYTEVDKELAGLAAQKNITIPRRLDPASQNTLAYMYGQKGAAIDREYTSLMADELATDAKIFRTAILHTQDPDIRIFAEKTLTKLEEDRRRADSILRNLPLPVLK